MADDDRILAKLDDIEAELKRIGYWSASPPPMPAQLDQFLQAPSFESWLQCVFLPKARERVASRDLPATSAVGTMALRQYDYQSHVPEAQRLVRLLREFDTLVESR